MAEGNQHGKMTAYMADVEIADADPEATQKELREAAAPFNRLSADVILRSSDRVNFRVWKNILAEASPFFHDLFSLPQPVTAASGKQQDEDDSVSVVPMTEDSVVLDKLLRFCYPIRDPEFASLDELRPVIDAAKKYLMDEALQLLRTRLLAFASVSPISTYAVAIRYGLEEEARHAAKCFLGHAWEWDKIYVPELEDISAGAYHRLLEYHRRCGELATGLVKIFRWIDSANAWVFLECSNCAGDQQQWYMLGDVLRTPRTWWMQHMERSGKLLENRPSAETIRSTGWTDQAVLDAMNCAVCKQKVVEHMRRFNEKFAAELDRVVSEVKLEIRM
ncbi:predicted protein [Postia placenta Mad-698-R]|uniref:BTB domain-containing protein n=1 Tax=Postia placenta MAD-698-R-SB12 TaxID=670580 RepID=A0A1X6N787_9APHY|nr:hypothetical protein POSPLADRAFT_1054959 [Postia placenta MAD-698-R-SB12]EED78396.1 predicted protein [Postia placenta Mad-698-R]OSX64352.1 hypothetical protein POSPLADRAFT_1054959 [Postia placenta MAD-698-R-SB12]